MSASAWLSASCLHGREFILPTHLLEKGRRAGRIVFVKLHHTCISTSKLWLEKSRAPLRWAQVFKLMLQAFWLNFPHNLPQKPDFIGELLPSMWKVCTTSRHGLFKSNWTGMDLRNLWQTASYICMQFTRCGIKILCKALKSWQGMKSLSGKCMKKLSRFSKMSGKVPGVRGKVITWISIWLTLVEKTGIEERLGHVCKMGSVNWVLITLSS